MEVQIMTIPGLLFISRVKIKVEGTNSVFQIIGKSHYRGQKRTQRLRCTIL